MMAMVKRGEVAFMVATDLAARGIDISDLGHVINYTLPEDGTSSSTTSNVPFCLLSHRRCRSSDNGRTSIISANCAFL